MKHTSKMALLSAAGLVLAAMVDNASAQIVINGGGSSAGRQLMGGTPASTTFCLPTPIPRKYRNNTPTDPSDDSGISRVTWVCNVTYSIPSLGITLTNQPVEIRYNSLESADGYLRLNAGGAQVGVIDASSPGAACDDLPISEFITVPAIPGRTVAYRVYNGCTSNVPANADFGASDVLPTSFGQTGPSGITVANPDASTLSHEEVAILPFSFFLSNNVRKRNANGTVGPQVDVLTKRQIRAILTREVRNWSGFGYGVSIDDAHTAFDANDGITLCRRDSGSGTLSALWLTVAAETPSANNAVNGLGGRVIYNSSSGTLTTLCFNETAVGHQRRSIGYLNSETVLPKHHRVLLEGVDANLPDDATFVPVAGGDADLERKTNIVCGRYDYWSGWRIVRKNSNEGTPINNLVRAIADNARNNTELSNPSGGFWPRVTDMKVFKPSGDTTPFNWITDVNGNVPSNTVCSR